MFRLLHRDAWFGRRYSSPLHPVFTLNTLAFVIPAVMQLIIHTLALLSLVYFRSHFTVFAASIPASQNARRSSSQCQPFYSTFDISHGSYTPFVGVSPRGSYGVDSNGLALYLEKPKQHVKTKNGVNDVVAEGATINSTFTILLVIRLSACRIP
jgi:hypothetical protein